MKLNQGNWRAIKTTMGAKDHQLRVVVVFYVKEGIKFKPQKDLDIDYHDTDIMNSNLLGLNKILNDNKPNTIIAVYYRHPKKLK